MNIIRIAIGIILAFFLISGLRRGLIRQVLEVVGLIAAFIGAFYLAHYLSAAIEERIPVPYNISLVIAALVVFACIIFIFHLVGVSLQKLFKMTVLGPFDRIMGGVFGLLKGVLLISLILVVLMSLPLDAGFHEELREDSLTGAIWPVLPVIFDMVVSRSGLDFNKVARIGEAAKLDKARENAEELKERIEKEKSRLDSTASRV